MPDTKGPDRKMPELDTHAEPMRACGACRTRCARSRLLRFAVRDGRVVPDIGRVLPGRGLSVGPALRCVERAVQRQAFGRGLKAALPDGGVEGLRREVIAAATEWLRHTLNTAARRGGAEVVADVAQVEPQPLRQLLERGGDAMRIIMPQVRVTHAGLAGKVAMVAATLSEFTFAIAGDSTRRPRPGEACEVLDGAPGAGSTAQRDVHDRRRAARMPTSSNSTGGGAG